MNAIIRFFINRSFIVNLVTAFIVIGGLVSLSSMNRDLIPPLEFQMISIHASLPGATPPEMEKHVTFPIEEALSGLPGVEKMKSQSQHSSTRIYLTFNAGYDQMATAVDKVNARINSIQHRLPDGLRNLNVQREQVTDVFLFFFGLENFDQTKESHRLFYKELENEIAQVPGVVSVDPDIKRRDVYVEFIPEKLARYEISMNEARQVLAQAYRMTPIGQTRVAEDKYSVQLAGAARSIEALANIPLTANRSGHSVLLKEVARVHYKLEDNFEKTYINGKPGASFDVTKDTSSDSIELKEKVGAVVADYNKKAPDGIRIVNIADGPHFIQQQIDVLSLNGMVGIVLVILILMLFLNWRTSIMTTLGLPVAYCGTLIVLYAMGINIDLLSIIGMILVVGILVDDAIIIAERYNEMLENGYPPKEAAFQSASELIVPVTGTVLTTLVAFSPFILIKSEMGEVLKAVPVVIIAALTLSWLESFFVLPNHLAHFVKKAPKEGRRKRVFQALQLFYSRILNQCIRFRYALVLLFVGLLVGAGYIGMNHIRHNFNLSINSERLSVYAILKESPDSETTYKAIQPIQDWLLSREGTDIENVYTGVGNIWMDGKRHEGYRYAKINAFINRSEAYPGEIKNRLKADIEKMLEEIKDERFEKLYAEVERQGSNEDKSAIISVRIRGAEDVQFTEIEKAIETKAVALSSIKEYSPNPDRYQRSWVFEPNYKALAQYGLSPLSLSAQMRGIFTPHEVTETRMGGERVFIYTELLRANELNFSELSNYEVLTPQGMSVPLRFMGEWKKQNSLRSISHYDGQRNLTMDFKIDKEGSNITVAKTELKEALKDFKTMFPTYQLEVIDGDEQQAKSQAWALKVALVCILGVLFVIALILGSLTQPLLVGLPIPFALIGTVLALYVHDLPLGLMAIVGIVGTIGVAVNASLVMVDQINRFRQRAGHMSREILIQGAASRLRAIVLTTVTTLGGVFPMAYAIGGESGFTQPLAFSLGWGLTFATVMTLFFLPAFLQIREDVLALTHKVLGRIFKGKRAELNEEERNKDDLPLVVPAAGRRRQQRASGQKDDSLDIETPVMPEQKPPSPRSELDH